MITLIITNPRNLYFQAFLLIKSYISPAIVSIEAAPGIIICSVKNAYSVNINKLCPLQLGHMIYYWKSVCNLPYHVGQEHYKTCQDSIPEFLISEDFSVLCKRDYDQNYDNQESDKVFIQQSYAGSGPYQDKVLYPKRCLYILLSDKTEVSRK